MTNRYSDVKMLTAMKFPDTITTHLKNALKLEVSWMKEQNGILKIPRWRIDGAFKVFLILFIHFLYFFTKEKVVLNMRYYWFQFDKKKFLSRKWTRFWIPFKKYLRESKKAVEFHLIKSKPCTRLFWLKYQKYFFHYWIWIKCFV